MTDPTLPFGTRFWFAFVCLFRVLFDPVFARRAFDASRYALPAPEPEPRLPAPKPEPVTAVATRPSTDAALQLLGLLQREGRLVDFLQQEIASFSDADIGAAARVIHGGCRRALGQHAEVRPIFEQDENTRVTLDADYQRNTVKLTGNLSGDPPHTGTLRHRGWRVVSFELPALMPGHDVTVLCPAEVEL